MNVRATVGLQFVGIEGVEILVAISSLAGAGSVLYVWAAEELSAKPEPTTLSSYCTCLTSDPSAKWIALGAIGLVDNGEILCLNTDWLSRTVS